MPLSLIFMMQRRPLINKAPAVYTDPNKEIDVRKGLLITGLLLYPST